MNGKGNAVANVIIGNAGDNVLSGMGGDDTLDGGGGKDEILGGDGNDVFVIRGTAGALTVISDFAQGDQIGLGGDYAALFAGGMLQEGVLANSTVATEPGHRLIFNAATGSLYYDPDGSGAAAATEIAVLAGVNLTAEDFRAMFD